jgi:hypothetical protein
MFLINFKIFHKLQWLLRWNTSGVDIRYPKETKPPLDMTQGYQKGVAAALVSTE